MGEPRFEPTRLGSQGRVLNHCTPCLFKKSIIGYGVESGLEEGNEGTCGHQWGSSLGGSGESYRLCLLLGTDVAFHLITSSCVGLLCWLRIVTNNKVNSSSLFPFTARALWKFVHLWNRLWDMVCFRFPWTLMDRLLPRSVLINSWRLSLEWEMLHCFNLHCCTRDEMYFWRLEGTQQLGG